MLTLLAPFVVGFLGSFHCLGMCGPLVAAYGLNLRTSIDSGCRPPGLPWQSGFFHHLAFHSGRLLTYGFLGILASGFVRVTDVREVSLGIRTGVTLAGGSLMIASGLALLRIIPFPVLPPGSNGASANVYRRWLSSLIHSRQLTSRIVLGMLTGFLPCMLSWSMVVQAAATGDLLLGFLTMFLFGLGTVPSLFLLGFSASMVSLKTRLLGERTAALSVILMGMILIFKGVRSLV